MGEFALRDDEGFGLVDGDGFGQLEGCGPTCCACWRPADTCPPLVPLPPECLAETLTVYVSCAARCRDAAESDPPLGPGAVFLFEGRCYTIRDETIPFEEIPEGATLLDETAEPECVPAGCLDARCNQAGLWVTGTPCASGAGAGQIAPSMPACGMTRCTVLKIDGVCWMFDPANAEQQIPLRPIQALQGFDDCCGCHDGVIDCHRLRDGYCGNEYTCCCDLENDRYEVTFSAGGSSLLRLTWTGPDFYGGGGQNFQENRRTYGESLDATPDDPGRTRLHETLFGETRWPAGDGRPPAINSGENDSEGHVPAGTCPPKPDCRDRAFCEWGYLIAGISIATLCSVMAAGGTLTFVDGSRRTTIGGSLHGDCTSASIAFTASVVDDESTPGPNGFRRYQEIHESVRWTLRRISAGPCRNGCGGGGGVGTKPGNRVRPDRIAPGIVFGTGDLGSGLGGFL